MGRNVHLLKEYFNRNIQGKRIGFSLSIFSNRAKIVNDWRNRVSEFKKNWGELSLLAALIDRILREFAGPIGLFPFKLAEDGSIQPWPEIGPVGFTATFLVPGLGALFNQCDFGVTF